MDGGTGPCGLGVTPSGVAGAFAGSTPKGVPQLAQNLASAEF